MEIRKISHLDLPEVSRIQQECYKESLLESVDSFSAKLSASPDFCFLAIHGNQVVGYVFSLQCLFGEIPQLNGSEYSVSYNADSLCIHDLAVSPTARNMGVAKHLVNTVLDAATHWKYERIFLVAIQGASSFWKRHGFEIVQDQNETLQRDLSAYGDDAVCMARTMEKGLIHGNEK
jgi:predicted N-acetyltransferase YhbS